MISIDWPSGIISVPKADLTPLGGELYDYDLDVFRLELKDLEDDEVGMVWPRTHNHVAPTTISGVTLARVVEIINGYTVTFEDGQYAVNLAGANSNVADVANVNQVSIRPQNSAGLVSPAAPQDFVKALADHSFGGVPFSQIQQFLFAWGLGRKTRPAGGKVDYYDEQGEILFSLNFGESDVSRIDA